jgi:hypothetical protein
MFILFSELFYLKAFISSSEQEKRKAILQSVNQKSVVEDWEKHGGPPKPRSQWDQQARLDSAVFNRQTVMNDSCSPNLSINGQAMNLNNINTPNRQQWDGGPRGTIINALQNANVYEDTMINETSDVSLKALSNRGNPNRKNETYVISTAKSNISSSPTLPTKPIKTDLIVEELNDTLTPQSKSTKSQK